jgi:uncharacterized RDD family membrane protein YckC
MSDLTLRSEIHAPQTFADNGGPAQCRPTAQLMADPRFLPIPYDPYVGFWRRFFAVLIDFILVAIVLAITADVISQLVEPAANQMVAERRASLLSIVVWWLYYALLESSPWQATPGKMVVGARVTDLAGMRISFLQATGRTFGKILSAIVLGIGFIMVAFNPRKQALHDAMVGTLVIKTSMQFASPNQVPPDRKADLV